MYTTGLVVVMELPQELNREQAHNLLEELQALLEGERPRLVLECSRVQHMDSAGVEMLLHCMQEAMKRDGDLKLAAVSPAAWAFMELLRVDRLFEVFETEREAVQSFGFRSYAIPQSESPYAMPNRELENPKSAVRLWEAEHRREQ